MHSSLSSSDKKVVGVAASKERKLSSVSSGSRGSGHFASKWAWVLIILLILAVIGLAIGLGVVAGKDDAVGGDGSISRRPYQAANPFDLVTDADAKSQMVTLWDGMDSFTRYNQITQLTSGTFSGPETATADAIGQMVERGHVGSMLNVNNASEANTYQKLSVDATGVPILIGYDTIHGYKTIFPMNIGMAASFNETMHYNHALLAGRETRAQGIHQVFGPMLDISRDSRWGRMSESCGECPFLTGKLGAAMVKGFQAGGVMPCVKHFAVYGGATAGRDYNPADMSMQSLYNDYLPAYKEAIDAGKGGPMSVMASFNTINNVPAHANRWLLSELLRGDWGFDGLVVSDYTGVTELVMHSLGPNETVTFAKSIHAGVDLEMAGNVTARVVDDALALGLIDEETLNIAAKRVMKAKFDIGLLPVNNDTLYVSEDVTTYGWVSAETLAAARDAARQSVLLLKNKPFHDVALPLNADGMKAGVIGYMAASPDSTVGSWAGQPRINDTVTFTAALVRKLGGPWDAPSPIFAFEPGFVRAFATTPINSNCTYDKDYNTIVPADWSFMGRNITKGDTDTAPGIANIPCFDDDIETPPQKGLTQRAIDLAGSADLTHLFIYLGESHSGGFQMSGEATSRSDLDLPPHQVTLLDKVLTAAKAATPAKHVTLIVTAGRGMSIEDQQADTRIDAILYAWALGTESGHALTDLIFNDNNIAATGFGRAPITFPRTVGQCPIFGEHMATGRPALEKLDWGNVTQDIRGEVKYKSRYIDVRWSPLYPFGFGLTYTTFKYKSISVVPDVLPATAGGAFNVSCTVANTGGVGGTEVVQLYYRQPHVEGVAVRPVRVLRGFQRVYIPAGQTTTVQFSVPVESLGFYNENMDFVIEKSAYEFYCSPNVENRDNADFVDPLAISSTGETPYTTLLPPTIVNLN